ncbi:hypothetical protein [Haloarchaeobius sp. FL176]|uniref:hypothetical protein n=1 Tax=Haloarchaeobius sp. FL176 TaxID=2967129 RepID=UPI0021492AE9|nr:hypothetical protein [Haloarchaeobius sp. FL176]
MKNHYTLENLRRAINNPVLFGREALRLGSLPIHRVYGGYLEYKYEDGIDVMDEDWDNLIVLDACRYDYFEELNTLDGALRREVSKGKKSWEFIRDNFTDRELYDTVYVTANPFSTDIEEGTFHDIDHLHMNRWDGDIGTVQPEEVVEAAVEAHEKYPNKRLIVHFMQPQRPYLGEMADRLRERVDLQGYGNHDEGIQIWGAVKQREITVDEIRTAYTESLQIVLESVEQLLAEVDGKSVITADHGEMLGERLLPGTTRVWGHMEGFSTPTLRGVPWLQIDSENRRDMVAEEPVGQSEFDDDTVSDRLAALGYR